MRKISLLLLIGSFFVADNVWSNGLATNTSPASAVPAKPLAAVPVSTPASARKIESLAQQAAREEIVRRQDAQIAARQLIDQGVKLHSTAKYADAIVKFEDALKMLPRAKATEADYTRAIHGVTDCYYHLADAAAKNKEYDKAKQLAQKALEYDPQNRQAENLIVRIKAEEGGAAGPSLRLKEVAADETPAFLEKRNQIKKLFREGKILLASGQFDEAEKRFQQILLLDPYNDDAHTLLEKVNTARVGFAEQAQEKFRTERLWEVSRGWIPPLGSQVEPPKPGQATQVRGESQALARTKEKLNRIILPEVSFRDATMTDVIRFFVDESRRLDEPTKEGVNFVLQADSMGGSNAPARQVSLNLHGIPLIEALRYATTGAGMEFRIEPNAVLVGTGLAQAGQMMARTYPVSGEAFRTTVISGTPPAAGVGGGVGQVTRMGGQGGTSTLMDVKRFFEDAGVPFPQGSTLVYNERASTIFVRNTTENLETFERVLASINVVPMQVEIEAKFVEISQNDLDELGFKWKVGAKTAGSFDVGGGSPSGLFPPGSGSDPNYNPDITQGLRDSTSIGASALDVLLAQQGFGSTVSSPDNLATIRGILTNPQFQLVIKALAQKKSADVLSAPKITTISGSAAQVKVVQEFIYPTAYNQPQVTAPVMGIGGAVIPGSATPSTPSTFNTREIGVLLNVTPTIGADGYTINLTMIPEVSEFLGFINYGGPYMSSGVLVPNDIKQPLFETRTLTTSVVVWDGQTVVMGGLIREQTQKIDDKVPFLGDLPFVGRLFRSKTTLRTKTNLLIFVTANLIDPAGNKIHKQSSPGVIAG